MNVVKFRTNKFILSSLPILPDYFMKINLCLFACVSILLLQSCKPQATTDLSQSTLIPKPVSVIGSGYEFELTENTTVSVADEDPDLKSLSNYLTSELMVATGFATSGKVGEAPEKGSIHLAYTSETDDELGDEGYVLSVEEDGISVKANKPAGIFYGIQTLLQLIPLQKGKYAIATGTIRDFPTWKWRGSMLDVARHFFSVDDVKRYIDLISKYKMNVLHLHLTDDQGWRIEIKSWPNLAKHGGTTQVGGGKGGYYTQEQYKEIVAYAAAHYITIVPEIDMPSHINAALAAYGHLNSPDTKFPKDGNYVGPLETQGIGDKSNRPTDLYTGIEVGWSTLSFSKEATMKFVNDVIRELAEMTPGPYIHIGGDEAHVTKKEDYIQFINQFNEIVKANGKQMIGWEEIAQANIDANAVVQHWHSEKYVKAAAAKAAQIIMSPSTRVYLDMQYDSTSRIGLHWAAYIEVDDAYNWDPTTQVDSVDQKQILGVEAPLWGETIVSMEDIEYLLFPRLPGIAEIGWSPAMGRSWDEYKVRLGKHGPRMKTWGIDYYPSALVPWVE